MELTGKELTAVIDLKLILRERELEYRLLEMESENLTPAQSEVPIYARTPNSKVERLAIKLAEISLELDEIRQVIYERELHLTEKLSRAGLTRMEMELMLILYVECYDFEESAQILGLTKMQVHKLHRRALRRLGVD